MTGRGRDIFPRPGRKVQLDEAAVRRRVLTESTPAVPEPVQPPVPRGALEDALLESLVAACERRNHAQRTMEREAAIVRDLILEASRAGVGTSRIARLAGVTPQRVYNLRWGSPEVRARQAERDAVFASGEAVEID